ncbi:hypothetical protein FQN50_008223 [Emmonsiellopsis sp. PD_5]|nr:hypothetical protein FQN50_008223 [Emmonsiellopsis sp. PD_5]
MEVITSNPLTSLAALSAAAGYLNAKFSISTDIRDIRDSRSFSRRIQERAARAKDTQSLYGVFIQLKVKDEVDAVWFEGRTLSYGELRLRVNQFAGVLHDRGVKAGDVVAVFTTNSPEMVIAVLAVSKLGAVAGLINTNLRNETFAHSLDVAKATYIVSTPDLAGHVISPLPHLSINLSSFSSASLPGNVEAIGLTELENAGHLDLQPAKRTITDIAILIYTSGTTGKPKACAIRNHMMWVTSTPQALDFNNPSKYYPLRSYSALPLFHGTAFFGILNYSLGCGGTICLARKFSVSKFWKDVTECKANRILYIGELCRYLLAAPPSEYDRAHQCTHAYGNGLRVEIWDKFKERFNVPEIREFYRSTEGMAKFDNHGSAAAGAGKIGFAGPLRRFVEDSTFVVKYDPETRMPVRDPKTGFCIKARLGEEGEVIGRIPSLDILSNYLNDDDATEKKILKDVFRKGDMFQRMGDLVIQEESGWVRFHERVGDTFRWKGENVSTGEVRDHICTIPNVMDAVVFGVRLDKYDGQAGGAAIALHSRNSAAETEFIGSLYQHLVNRGVPSYALPRLVRIVNSIATGFTFKQAKTVVEKLPWDPKSVVVADNAPGSENAVPGDTLYWLNGAKGTYERLDGGVWSGLQKGTVRL